MPDEQTPHMMVRLIALYEEGHLEYEPSKAKREGAGRFLVPVALYERWVVVRNAIAAVEVEIEALERASAERRRRR